MIEYENNHNNHWMRWQASSRLYNYKRNLVGRTSPIYNFFFVQNIPQKRFRNIFNESEVPIYGSCN